MEDTKAPPYDVIVIGAGNAALAAAVSARENGAEKVVVLEKAPREMRGGNTHWSGGVLRFAYDDPREIGPLLPGVEEEFENFYDGISPYTQDDYHGDLMRVTSGRTDPVLSKLLVTNSQATVRWMKDTGGIKMEPAITLSAVKKDNVMVWARGLVVRAAHEGVGLSRSWFATAERFGIERPELHARRAWIFLRFKDLSVTLVVHFVVLRKLLQSEAQRFGRVFLEIEDQDGDGLDGVAGGFQYLQTQARKVEGVSIGHRHKGVLRLGAAPQINDGTAAVAQFEMPGDEVGVEVG